MICPPRQPVARSGASVVEVAFVMMFFCMFLFGIVEFGRLMMVRHTLNAACREGARVAATGTSSMTTSQIQTAAFNTLGGMQRQFNPNLTSTSFNVYEYNPTTPTDMTRAWASAEFGDQIAVNVSGSYRTLLPNLLRMPQTLTLTATALINCEANN